MLNLKKIVGVIAMVAIIGMAFFSCEEEKAGLVPSLPGVSIKDAPTFPSTVVATKAEALALLGQLMSESKSDFKLNTAMSAARSQAISIAKTAGTYDRWSYDDTSYTDSYDYKDATVQAAYKAALEVNEGSISGSYTETWSSNLSVKQFNDVMYYKTRPAVEGDNVKSTEKSKLTMKFPLVKKTGLATTQLGGVIMANSSSSGNMKLIDIDNEAKTNYMAGKNKETEQYAAALTYDNGTKGAKFRFSCSYGETSVSKSITDQDGYAASDIEVYDNDNKKIFTIKNDSNLRGFFY